MCWSGSKSDYLVKKKSREFVTSWQNLYVMSYVFKVQCVFSTALDDTIVSYVRRLLHVSRADLYLGQVEDFREDADVVGVWDEGVKPLTAGHGGRYALQLVTAHIQLLQQLQLAQLTEKVNTGTDNKQTWDMTGEDAEVGKKRGMMCNDGSTF